MNNYSKAAHRSSSMIPAKQNTNYIRVHNYVVGELIAKNEFSEIRMAIPNYLQEKDISSHHLFAVKIIPKSKLRNVKIGKMMLFNESILAPLLSSPHIIDFIDVDESITCLFQFMKFAHNYDLKHQLQLSLFSRETCYKIIDQLLAAVEYLHANGIAHRDIKLENILLTESNKVKLTDFGFATLSFDGNVSGNFGSLDYAAPESITQKCFNGFSADMWSVGVVIYSIFAKTLPFQPSKINAHDYSATINMEGIPEDMIPLIKSLLSIDPKYRFSATGARMYLSSLIGKTQVKKCEPLSMLVDPDFNSTNFKFLVSKLSQVLRTSIPSIIEKLNEVGSNKIKLLYNLLRVKFENCGFYFTYHLRNSKSAPIRFNIIPQNKIDDQSDKFIEQKEYPVFASALYSYMHSFLLNHQCCISSPISSLPMIIQKKDDIDLSLSFVCNDITESDKIKSVISLKGDKNSLSLSKGIFHQLDKTFLT